MLTWPSFSSQNGSDIPETITSRDAARFPIIASVTLFGLYLFFKVPVSFIITRSEWNRLKQSYTCTSGCRCFLKNTSTCCCRSTSLPWASWHCLTPWGRDVYWPNPNGSRDRKHPNVAFLLCASVLWCPESFQNRSQINSTSCSSLRAPENQKKVNLALLPITLPCFPDYRAENVLMLLFFCALRSSEGL